MTADGGVTDGAGGALDAAGGAAGGAAAALEGSAVAQALAADGGAPRGEAAVCFAQPRFDGDTSAPRGEADLPAPGLPQGTVVPAPVHRSGFVCLAGRPNAGKSTLTNALVGQKVAIASSKPQTTRHAVRGILTRPDAQLVLIDTPGLSKPRSLLQERLNDLVRETWGEVDVIGVCLPCDQRPGPGDLYLARAIAALDPRRRPRLVAVATKADLASPERLRRHLLAIDALAGQAGLSWEHIVPCSAVSGQQVGELADVLFALLEPGPAYYPDGELTDEPETTLVAELIREAALEEVRDELPHSITVTVDEMGYREGRPDSRPLLDIFASLVVERESQKHIMVGARGSRIKQVGTDARHQIAALLGVPVHLDLRVKVVKDWQSNAKQLDRLGF